MEAEQVETPVETHQSDSDVDDLEYEVIEEDTLPFEEECTRNPFSVKSWLLYIEFLKKRDNGLGGFSAINEIYERALKHVPGSYKIWYRYLQERKRQIRGKCVVSEEFVNLTVIFERALITMHKMPRIWVEYLECLLAQRRITTFRRKADEALSSLPITQHLMIWSLFVKFARSPWVPLETACLIYRRYIQLEPAQIEEYVEFLLRNNKYREACDCIVAMVNRDRFMSIQGKTTHDWWVKLCHLCKEHPEDVEHLNVENIIRSGLKRYTEDVGKLWAALGEFYVKKGHFDMARNVFEEGVNTVITVRDFTIIFQSYSAFEERYTETLMEEIDEDENAIVHDDVADEAVDVDVDLSLARFDFLIKRRPLLINSVLLRQNPHNTIEWQRRVKLMGDDKVKIVSTFTAACKTIDANNKNVTGRPHYLWTQFAKFYEDQGDLDSAREVFAQSIKEPHAVKTVDDLAHLWANWAEMEIRHQHIDKAQQVLRSATAEPPAAHNVSYRDYNTSPHLRIHKNLRLWLFRVDLEENLGTVDTVKSLYTRMFDLKVATPKVVINCARYLTENNYFEDAFQSYERWAVVIHVFGVNLFTFPHCVPIWREYLAQFTKRYNGEKIERARDLYEQCVTSMPAEEKKPFYLRWARLEEEHGSIQRAMIVYDQASLNVADEHKGEIYRVYAARAAKFFGPTKSREVYERAVNCLHDKDARDVAVKFAQLELKLGEVDRSRAIFAHGSQFANPSVNVDYYESWQEFEVAHGNEETFREMLRIKRSVQAQFDMSPADKI